MMPFYSGPRHDLQTDRLRMAMKQMARLEQAYGDGHPVREYARQLHKELDPAKWDEALCKTCKGTGTCAKCDGTGLARDISGEDYTDDVCWPCAGDGTCCDCDGTGYEMLH